jgi:serine/threonine protein kinase
VTRDGGGPGDVHDPVERAAADPAHAETALAHDGSEVSEESESFLADVARAPAHDVDLFPGAVVGRFTLLETIGRGGFGVVYKARDNELGRLVALKVMRTRGRSDRRLTEALASLFRREAEAAARLNHPNIVTLYDHGTIDGHPFLILELLGGETLDRRLDRGPLTVDEALPLAIQVAQGLAHAHTQGVAHGDLKPSNVFLTDGGRVKILDFGLAQLQVVVGTLAPSRAPGDGAGGGRDGSRLAETEPRSSTGADGAAAGTPAYMAPEQWRGQPPDERSDLTPSASCSSRC